MLYEIIDEEGIVHSYKLHSRPKPIIKKREFRLGDKAPGFTINPGNVLWATEPLGTGRWLSSLELTRRPLIISFFCAGWGAYTAPMLQKLNDLHRSAEAAGATLLVLTQTPTDQLTSLAAAHDIAFTLAYDKNNRLAQLFGAYQTGYPVWDRIAGINEDVITPGIFVINSQEKFLYAHLDKDFEMEWNDQQLNEVLPERYSESRLVKFA